MKKYPITYWGGPPIKFTSKERYLQIADAGFTHASPPFDIDASLFNKENNLKILDLCHELGLKVNVSDCRMQDIINDRVEMKDTLDRLVEDYSSHPAVDSYYLADEPGADLFKKLGEINAYLKDKDENHYSYINLFPNYASQKQLQAENYEEHLERFINEVKPEIISYDHYHFMKNGQYQEKSVENEKERLIYEAAIMDKGRPGFFDNIEIVREKSLKYNIPFMVIVLLVEHADYKNLTEAEIRWEVFQSLVYGASMISYFTYWTPFQCDDELWKWMNGMISFDGLVNEHYYQVKRVNMDLQCLGSKLLGKKSIAVYHVGQEKENVVGFKPDANILSITGGSITVGLFEEGYILLANKDYESETHINITIDPAVRILKLNKQTNKEENITNLDGNYEILLNAGDAELLKLDKS